MTSFDSAVGREIVKRIQDEMNVCLQRLASGTLPDHAEYVRWSSRYTTYASVVEALREVEEALKS